MIEENLSYALPISESMATFWPVVLGGVAICSVWFLAARRILRRRDAEWISNVSALNTMSILPSESQAASAELYLQFRKGRPSDRLFLHGIGLTSVPLIAWSIYMLATFGQP